VTEILMAKDYDLIVQARAGGYVAAIAPVSLD
jgi:hypothetical protein